MPKSFLNVVLMLGVNLSFLAVSLLASSTVGNAWGSSCVVGYSGVVFGLVAFDAFVAEPSREMRLCLVLSVRARLVPWVLLGLTCLLFPAASFLGHVVGVLAGMALALRTLPSNWAAWSSAGLPGITTETVRSAVADRATAQPSLTVCSMLSAMWRAAAAYLSTFRRFTEGDVGKMLSWAAQSQQHTTLNSDTHSTNSSQWSWSLPNASHPAGFRYAGEVSSSGEQASTHVGAGGENPIGQFVPFQGSGKKLGGGSAPPASSPA